MKKKRKKKWIILGVVAAVVLAVVVFLQGASRQMGAALAQETAITGSITSYYSFTGNVKVKDSQDITATADVTIREIYVKEGDWVGKNDRLLRTSGGETIKAGIPGEIEKLHVEKEDEVKVGDALIDIVDFNNMVIEIKVDEFDIPAVEAGKGAIVTVNALDSVFDATVVRLNRQATKEGDLSYYVAELSMGEDTSGVLPGMQVDVKILNANVDNVTTLSMNALQFTDANEAYVMVQGTEGIKNVFVTLGVNDGVRVEIIDGLRSGETVLVPAKAADMSMMFMAGGQGRGMRGGGQ